MNPIPSEGTHMLPIVHLGTWNKVAARIGTATVWEGKTKPSEVHMILTKNRKQLHNDEDKINRAIVDSIMK